MRMLTNLGMAVALISGVPSVRAESPFSEPLKPGQSVQTPRGNTYTAEDHANDKIYCGFTPGKVSKEIDNPDFSLCAL